MSDLLLTSLLLIMSLLLMQKETHKSGLYTGLWISLFFWGRIHPSFSVIIFSAALVSLLFSRRNSEETPSIYIKRQSLSQFIFFLGAMMIFCGLAEVLPSYGRFLQLDSQLLQSASFSGFLASIAGPVIFGIMNDKKGIFPAMITLILAAAIAVGAVSYSSISPVFYLIGEILLWLSVSGTFTLLPIFIRLYFGKKQMNRYAARLVILQISLWAIAYYSFQQTSDQTNDSAAYLIFSVCLTLVAALSSTLSWKNRLTLIQ